jgi:hypothetical protein
MGFAPLSYSLLNQYSTGEAPQLSYSYGEYDDGANVFSFYDNFAGSRLNSSKWSTNGTATLAVNNGLYISGNSDYVWLYGKIPVSAPSIADIYVTSYTSHYAQIRLGFSRTQDTSTNYDFEASPVFGSSGSEKLESAYGGFAVTSQYIASWPSSFIGSSAWGAAGNELIQVNYGYVLTGANTVYPMPPSYYPGAWFVYRTAGPYTENSQWIRTRTFPPDGVMPSVGYAGFQNYTSQPSVSIEATPSPSSIAAGNRIIFNALVTSGAAPFTYTFQVYNTVTFAAINSTTTTSNSFTFATNSNLLGSTIAANVFVADVLGQSSNSLSTGSFTITAPPTTTSATTPPTSASTTTVGQAGCTGGICGSGGTGAYGASTPTTLPTTSIITSSSISASTSSATSLSTTVYTTTTVPITVKPIPAPSNAFTVSTNSSLESPAVVNFTSSNAILRFYSNSTKSTGINVSIENIKGEILLPPDASTILAINITSHQRLAMISETLKYPCSENASSIAPYELTNGTWRKIPGYTADPSSCTVTFSTPGSSATIALVYGNLAQAQNSQYLSYAAIFAAGIVATVIAFMVYRIAARRGRRRASSNM